MIDNETKNNVQKNLLIKINIYYGEKILDNFIKK